MTTDDPQKDLTLPRKGKRRGRPKLEPRPSKGKGDILNIRLPRSLIPEGINVILATSKKELKERWGFEIPDDLNWTHSIYERVAVILETIARRENKSTTDTH